MICNKCKKNNADDALFCEFCGKKLKAIKPKKEKIDNQKEVKIKTSKEDKNIESIKEIKPVKKVKEKKVHKKVNKKILIISIIGTGIILIVVGLMLFYLLYKVTVPSLIGMKESQAISLLKKNGLRYEIEYNEKYMGNDLVDSQSISANNKTKLFTKIKFIVSRTKDYSNAQWSEWISTLPSDFNKEEYIIEEKKEYSYRKKETKTSSSSKMSGYTLLSSKYTNEYTDWTNWSTDKVTSSDTRKIETKTEYSSRTKSISTYWTNWSDYSTTKEETSQLKEERTRKMYKYFYFPCSNGYRSHDSRKCWSWACYWLNGVKKCGDNSAPTSTSQTQTWSTKAYDYSGSSWQGTGTYIINLEGNVYFYRSAEEKIRTEYSYRLLKEKTTYSSWSSYSETEVVSSNDVEVRTRTCYRYKDKIKEYTFYRWSNWSDYQSNEVSSSNTIEVKTKTYYRYTIK